jgi:hypothetical protein
MRRLPCPSLPPSHSWAHVIIGMWHKYPNPHCSHVVTVDVIDRSVNPVTGLIRTERVLGCKQRTPTWIVKVRLYSSLSCRSLYDMDMDSSLVAQKMHSFVRSRLWIHQHKLRPYLPSICRSLNSQHVTKRSPIPLLLVGGLPSIRRQRFKHEWSCGELRQTS